MRNWATMYQYMTSYAMELYSNFSNLMVLPNRLHSDVAWALMILQPSGAFIDSLTLKKC